MFEDPNVSIDKLLKATRQRSFKEGYKQRLASGTAGRRGRKAAKKAAADSDSDEEEDSAAAEGSDACSSDGGEDAMDNVGQDGDGDVPRGRAVTLEELQQVRAVCCMAPLFCIYLRTPLRRVAQCLRCCYISDSSSIRGIRLWLAGWLARTD